MKYSIFCLVRCLYPVNKNLEEIKNVNRKFAKQLKCKEVKFSFHKKKLWKNRKIK